MAGYDDLQRIIVDIAKDLGDEDLQKVVNVMLYVNEITDEELSQKVDLKLNKVRKVLYKLHENHLAGYRRIRHPEKPLYIYFWKLYPNKIPQYLISKKIEVLNKLKASLEYEENNLFFVCPINNDHRYNFNDAMEFQFICPECEKPLEALDNSIIKEILRNKIKELKKDLEDAKSIMDLDTQHAITR